MDAPSFADLWQQEEFSDVEVLLTAADATLSRFPGHNVILSRSPYFAAQVGWLGGAPSGEPKMHTTSQMRPWNLHVSAMLPHNLTTLDLLREHHLVLTQPSTQPFDQHSH